MSANLLIEAFSVFFHFITAILAIRLIKITGHKIAWILISSAIVIQLIRRSITLWYLLAGPTAVASLLDELIALVISTFMLIGVARIAPLFLSIRRSEEKMKRAKIKAEEERAKTESIIAAIGDGISIQDRDLIITYQNDIHISFFGDQKGKKCHQAYNQEETSCDECPVLCSFDDGVIHSKEMTFATATKTSFFEITASPLRDAGGHIIAGIEVVRNVDQRKKMEQERETLINDLQEALANIKTLRGLIPICAACKKIRDDKGYWNQIESYIRAHSDAEFSHGICPDCAKRLYPDYYDEEMEATDP
jgi:signal transduction histidine kinase